MLQEKAIEFTLHCDKQEERYKKLTACIDEYLKGLDIESPEAVLKSINTYL
jgi:hypothetical protein